MGKKIELSKKYIVSARLNKTEHAALAAIARKRRVPLSEIVRERLLGTMLGGSDPADAVGLEGLGIR